jgi:hypothetical protein
MPNDGPKLFQIDFNISNVFEIIPPVVQLTRWWDYHRVATRLVLYNRAGGVGVGTPDAVGLGRCLNHRVTFKAANRAFDLIGRAHCFFGYMSTMRAR